MSQEQSQPELHLQSFTYHDRGDLMPQLGVAIDAAGGWILDRRPISPDALRLHMEVQTQALPEVYGAMLASGLELTRGSHRALAERCNCSLHLRPSRSISSIILISVEVHFLPDPPQALDLGWLFQLTAGATA